MLKPLSSSDAQRLVAGQLLTSTGSVVKELVENALDAGSESIVLSVSPKLDVVAVRDDGRGIPVGGRDLLGTSNCTSKIESFEDLYDVRTFGFRGEALRLIVQAAESVTVVTKTDEEPTAERITFERGVRVSSTRVAATRGTSITVKQPLARFPVRQRAEAKAKSQTVAEIQRFLYAIALQHPKLRLSSSNPQLQKYAATTTEQGLVALLGKPVVQQLAKVEFTGELNASNEAVGSYAITKEAREGTGGHGKVELSGYWTRPGANLDVNGASRSRSNDRVFLFVNGRPARVPVIEDLITRLFREHGRHKNIGRRYPVAVLFISLPAGTVDYNLSPNKADVLIRNVNAVVEQVEQALLETVPAPMEVDEEEAVLEEPPADDEVPLPMSVDDDDDDDNNVFESPSRMNARPPPSSASSVSSSSSVGATPPPRGSQSKRKSPASSQPISSYMRPADSKKRRKKRLSRHAAEPRAAQFDVNFVSERFHARFVDRSDLEQRLASPQFQQREPLRLLSALEEANNLHVVAQQGPAAQPPEVGVLQYDSLIDEDAPDDVEVPPHPLVQQVHLDRRFYACDVSVVDHRRAEERMLELSMRKNVRVPSCDLDVPLMLDDAFPRLTTEQRLQLVDMFASNAQVGTMPVQTWFAHSGFELQLTHSPRTQEQMLMLTGAPRQESIRVSDFIEMVTLLCSGSRSAAELAEFRPTQVARVFVNEATRIAANSSGKMSEKKLARFAQALPDFPCAVCSHGQPVGVKIVPVKNEG